MKAADVARAIRESAAFIWCNVHERRRAAFGVAIAAKVRVNEALLDFAASVCARSIDGAGGRVPRIVLS